MVRVRIDYCDGCYSLIEASEGWDESAVEISETIWRAYCAYLDQGRVWYDLIRRMDNELIEKSEGG